MANNSITATYESLPKIVKILLQLILGGIIGGIYRIVRFVETKNTVTLVAGLLCTFTGVGNFIAWVVDLITEITSNQITVLAD
ncbi:MAG: hypothetical protein J6B09_07725 [Clostridia bacterium]|nr:hypothetical protein [Clostridia bacterium]MBQ8716697.1 hypothetical protein [Clostridia bacterium]